MRQLTREQFDDAVNDLFYELLSNVDARFDYMSEKRNCLSELVEMLDHENGDYFDDLAQLRKGSPPERRRPGRPRKDEATK